MTEPDGSMSVINCPRKVESLESITVTDSMLEEYLHGLDVSSAPGPDGFSPAFLRACSSSLSGPLCTIMNRVLSMGYLPSAWRQSTVTPIFKKGDKLKAENYRPISLTSVVVKVLERVISKQMLQFALRESIIPQHGFVPGRSIITNLLTCLNDWTKSLDAGIPMDVVYLDFAKAFNLVPRRRLLHKLEHFGIRGSLMHS